jgi:D-hydroxyproline dehydrogenase subunit alpha
MIDVVVIGAGPAGLAAARAARRGGAAVTLLDAADDLGGQYWRHLPATRPSSREQILHHGWKKFRELSELLEHDPGCRILRSASVWSVEPREGGTVILNVLVGPSDGSDREQVRFAPSVIILATGAYDRALPFPGWDLPGVFTGGAGQAMAKGERIAVGSRVVVAGAGPFLLPVAASLAATGSTVIGIFEASGAAALASGWLPKPWLLLRSGGKGRELVGYLAGHIAHRIPYRLGYAIVRAHGSDRLESVTVARVDSQWRPIAGTDRVIEADAVCVTHGFTPRLELAVASGCELTADGFVRVDENQLTSVPGVYAAGEVTGIGGVELALVEGEIAGSRAAATGSPASARSRRRVAEEFAGRIEAAHGIRNGWADWLTDETIVCRCEGVTHGALCADIDAMDGPSLRSVKLASRAGLGICQGRMCGATIEDILRSRIPGYEPGTGSADNRPIAVPIRLGELAAVPKRPHSDNPDPTEGTP